MSYITITDAFNELGKLLFPEEWNDKELEAYTIYKLVYQNNEIAGLLLKNSWWNCWVFKDSIERSYKKVAISDVMLKTYYTSRYCLEIQAFFMPALTAIRYNTLIKVFAERLLQTGKPKKVVAASMRKLVHIVYGVLKNQTVFQN